ncbi:hypothetical protein [Methyloversatilis discipulorum]|uniref:hypothetical protein n=1 Tax=Methyloversatilis discipulorum TaxID=1119528 RepID=UPI0003750E9B|nr:hypothetical protein [Methyloversatilis discipulorum]
MTNPCQGHAAESARADYKKEAERLADAIVREVAELPDRDSPADWPAAMLVTSDELRGIVLARIQRGAVPEGWHLDESEAALLHHLTSPDDDRVHPPITLRVGNVRMDDGVVKFGLLCEYTDYPDEGATLLVEGQPTVAAPAPAEVPMTQAATDVLAERQRQISAEGWTPDHDDEHVCDEIAAMACFYAMPPGARDWDASSTGYGASFGAAILPEGWEPKTGDRRRELIKAGALIIAEIERLDRAEAASRKTSWLCPNCPTPDLCLRIQGCDRDEIAR